MPTKRRRQPNKAEPPFTSPAAPAPSHPHRAKLFVLILVAAVLICFGQASGHQFLHWDDDLNVTDNPYLNPLTWDNFLMFWRQPVLRLYVPLTYSWFALETYVSRLVAGSTAGPQPWIFHMGNVLLHLLSVLMVYALLFRLVKDPVGALTGALLFGVHPIQSETVNWVTESKGALSALFSFLTLWFYVRVVESQVRQTTGSSSGRESARSTPTWQNYTLATACFLLALLAKPSAVCVPLMAAVLDWGWFRRSLRQVGISVAPWLAIGALLAVWTKTMQSTEAMEQVTPLWGRPLVALDAVAFYLYKILIPWAYLPDYGRNPSSLLHHGWVYWTWAVPLIVAGALWRFGDRQYWVAAGLFVAAVLPVLGLIPFAYQDLSTVADRYVYLAMFGPALGAASLVSRNPGRVTYWVAAGVMLLFATSSFLQTRRWQNDETLFSYAVNINPQSFVTRNNLSFVNLDKGQYEQAAHHAEQAVTLHPKDARARNNLGLALLQQGKIPDAVRELGEAVRLDPGSVLAQMNLAIAYARAGEKKQGDHHFREAWRMAAPRPKLQFELAKVAIHLGETDDALKLLHSAVTQDPRFAEALSLIGAVYVERGESEKAEKVFRRALEIEPLNAEATCGLGDLYLKQGEVDKAIEQFRLAAEYDPRLPVPHIRLGELAIKRKDEKAALAEYAEATRLAPREANLHITTGQLAQSTGDLKTAVEHYREAYRLEPQRVDVANNLAWILATCPDDTLRDGLLAVKLAEEICAANRQGSAEELDTLAAAYAEANRFSDAVRTARRAVELAQANQSDLIEGLRARLALYEKGEKYREP